MEEQTNINNCRVSELNKQNINCIYKFVIKFVAKLHKYVILFKDTVTLDNFNMFILTKRANRYGPTDEADPNYRKASLTNFCNNIHII